MDKHERVLDILEAGKINWSVTKERLVSQVDGQYTSSYGIFRSDTRGHLGTVGERYVPIQNHELAELVVDAAGELGLDAHNSGCMAGGSKVFIQIGLPDAKVGIGDVKRYITAMNTHDGTSKIGLGTSNTFVKCQNTFWRAFRDIAKVLHTARAHERLGAMVDQMKLALQQEENVIQTFERMREYEIDGVTGEKIITEILTKVYDIDMKEKHTATSRTGKRLLLLQEDITTEIALEGANLLGIFNGITRFNTHHAVREHKQLEYVASGAGYRTNNQTYDLISDFMGRTGVRNYRMS